MRKGAPVARVTLAVALVAGLARAQGDATPPVIAPTPAPATAPAPPDWPPLALYVPPPPPPVQAPHYALWLGGRLGVLAYGGGLYLDNRMTGAVETTGNFVQPGVALQVDVGARLAKRYIPYDALELGVLGAGHRFDGVGGAASTTFTGVGFRYLAGDPDSFAFLADVSFGLRQFVVSSGGSTWKATGPEILRLGFGVEVRLMRQLTLSPMITLSGGALTSTSGYVAFSPNQGDGQVSPPFVHGAGIPQADQASYYAVVVGCGIHADLFGR